MKNIVYIAILILFTGCGNFLDEYSQDLVVPKTVSDLNEVLLGNGYVPSSEVQYLRSGSIGWQLNILDDDINTVIAYVANKGLQEMDQVYYGYTTWQMEVGRNYTGNNLSGDNANWDALYQRINSMNIILHELGNVSQSTEQDKMDAIRVQGECYFLRAQFYLLLVNMYAKASSGRQIFTSGRTGRFLRPSTPCSPMPSPSTALPSVRRCRRRAPTTRTPPVPIWPS